MRASQYFIPTMRETPKDAEIISHQYMLKAGLIRKLGSGLYTWLPLGLRVLKKIEHIIREELNQAGAIELLMPAIQPAELWQETGRWDTFGGQLLTMKDNQERSYCFGPTHEEVITDLMRNELKSYKQLPINVYQIQTKFRDEIRPRFGVMRAREFIMKDAYSFHLTQDSLQDTYSIMRDAYQRILTRMGLNFRAVEADTGAIGGAVSHEFQVLADAGEDLIFYSSEGTYAANIEQATHLKSTRTTEHPLLPLTLVATPQQKTIAEICEALQVQPHETIKTLLVKGCDTPLVALVLRGDDELNLIKAAKHPKVQSPVMFADEALIQSTLNVAPGFIGPVGLKNIPIIVDHEALSLPSFVCGANQNHHHYRNAAWDRDAHYDEVYDLRNVQEGDISPDGNGVLHACRGIEVGHIFQLGEKYAKDMGAQVLTPEGKTQTLLMGCYGLGVSRMVAAAIEQHHDERGICWPLNIAPFTLGLIPINGHRCDLVRNQAEKIYQECLALGIDVLLDDRNERPGVLFADHDLIGLPHRLIVSERHLEHHEVEYQSRKTGVGENIALTKLSEFLSTLKTDLK